MSSVSTTGRSIGYPFLVELKGRCKNTARMFASRPPVTITNRSSPPSGWRWRTGSSRVADGQQPKNRAQISTKIREVLLARHASNKKKHWLGGSIRLNDQEMAVVRNKDTQLAKCFFERFFPWCRAQGVKIEEGTERSTPA